MKLKKALKYSALTVVLALSTAMMSGCGGVSEAQLAELANLKQEVNSLQSEANSLKDERAKLEKEIAAKNAKLQECAKDKAEAKANLNKIPD